MNVQELINRYNKGERFRFTFFWGGNTYLSNWYPSDFVVDGVNYWCTEQYMMAKKAELFNDYEVLDMIMHSDSQREIKALGRKIRGFNDNVWIKNRERVVYEGNYAKFTQNEKLYNYMLKQKDKILVEASPYDKIWGIGLDSSDKEYVSNPNNWRGINLLGFTLMKVRDQILFERGC